MATGRGRRSRGPCAEATSRRLRRLSAWFEYHGWATIRDTAGSEDIAEDPSPETIERLRESIRRLRDDLTGLDVAVELRRTTDQWHLSVAGYHYHYKHEIVAFFAEVARIAPGSYGLFYSLSENDAG